MLVLFAVIAAQQTRAGFPWFKSKPIKVILSLRVAELLGVALVPTLATKSELISPVFTLNDIVAVTAMIGFSAGLVAFIWTMNPGRVKGDDHALRPVTATGDEGGSPMISAQSAG